MAEYALTGLEGKVAVVTGAGRVRSIGRPVAGELALTVLEHFGRVDIVVDDAGAARGDDRNPVVDRFGAEPIRAGRGGSIVNMSSIAGKKLPPNTAAYAASEAGIQALTASMAQEVGSHGVRVNAICPGLIDTAPMDLLGRDDIRREMVGHIPLGRAGVGGGQVVER